MKRERRLGNLPRIASQSQCLTSPLPRVPNPVLWRCSRNPVVHWSCSFTRSLMRTKRVITEKKNHSQIGKSESNLMALQTATVAIIIRQLPKTHKPQDSRGLNKRNLPSSTIFRPPSHQHLASTHYSLCKCSLNFKTALKISKGEELWSLNIGENSERGRDSPQPLQEWVVSWVCKWSGTNWV